MSDMKTTNIEPKLTGRQYSSLETLMKGEGFKPETIGLVRDLSESTRVARTLAFMRVKADLTQSEMAAKLGKSQAYVSKLESEDDNDITLGEIRAYTTILNQRIGIVYGPPMSHVQSIKAHAIGMRQHMRDLAKIAHQDEQLDLKIQAFFGEAFFNFMSIMEECQRSMPNGVSGCEVKIEVGPRALEVGSDTSNPAPSMASTSPV